jgi:hypothetical protein
VGYAEPLKRNVTGVDEITGATDYALPFVQEKQVPTLLVTLHVVPTLVVQFPGFDCSVSQIDGAPKPLHIGKELVI